MPAAAAQPGTAGVLGFSVQGESLALPAADVLQIVRVPPCTRVPNAPPSLVGVANLRGSVLPVVSTARLLGRPAAAGVDGPAARVVVVAGPVGLLVDAVSSLSRTVEGRMLDPAALLAPAFGGLLRRVGAPRDAGTGAAPAVAAAGPDAAPLIGFRLAAQDYALPLERVVEVLRVPATLVALPRTDDTMLGVIAFRGGLLPVVSLQALLGLPAVTADPAARLVVTWLEGMPAGLLVDQVSGIIAVPSGAIDPVPPVLLRGAGEGQLTGICRLEGGRRLVVLLSPERLLDPATTARIRVAKESATMPVADASLLQDAGSSMEQFIVFRLGEEQYGLPIEAVDEVVRRPDALTRMPHAPDFVAGVMNLRGRAIPVIHASRRFGAAAGGAGGRVVVVTVDGVQAGLAVDAVSEVMGVASSALRAAPAFEDGCAPLFDRVAIERGGRMILLISARELLEQAERDLLASLADADAARP